MTDDDVLELIASIFGSGAEVRARGRVPWPPPNGGWDPARRYPRRVSSKAVVLDIVPSEHVVGGVDSSTVDAPTLSCPTCTSAAWHRAGSGWTCATCHPPVSGAPVLPPVRRADVERLLRRTRSVKKRAVIQAALAAWPAEPERSPSSTGAKAQRWKAPRIATARMVRERTWDDHQCRECLARGATHERTNGWWVCASCHARRETCWTKTLACQPDCPGCGGATSTRSRCELTPYRSGSWQVCLRCRGTWWLHGAVSGDECACCLLVSVWLRLEGRA
jgi:hypothetical protein